MAPSKRQKVLRVAVLADGQVCEEFHQTQPGHLDVGRGGANDVHVYDAHLRPKDRRKHAPLWFGIGLAMSAAGMIWFGKLVYDHGIAQAAADAAGTKLSSFFGDPDATDFGVWAMALALLGMIPLISGFTAMREAPPPRMPAPAPNDRAAPTSHRLFRYDANARRYELDMGPEVAGNLKLGRQKTSVKALRKRRGDAQGRVRLVLPNDAKGELRVGSSTLLFKITSPQRAAPFLRFPIAFIDRWQYLRLTPMDLAIQVSVAVLLGSFFVALMNIEATEPEISSRFMDVMGIVEYTPEEEPEEEPEEDPEEEVLEVEDKEQPTEEIIDDKVLAEKPETFSTKAMQKARGVGVARVLGTYGGPGEGSVIDVISSTENNLGELFAQGMTQTVYSDGSGVSPFIAGGEGISAHGSMAQTQGLTTADGPAAIEGTQKKERKVKSRIKSSTDEVYGDVDKKMVKAIIRRRMAGLKACYDKALRSQPGLSGRMSFTIEIAVVGRVTRVNVEQDSVGDAKVKSCVTAKIRSWRFPVEDAEEPAEVSFSVVFEGGS